MEIRRHISTRTEQIHRCLAVPGMVLIFFQQTPGRYCFPLTRFVQTFTVTDDRQTGLQSGDHICFLITSAEQHDLTFHDPLPAFIGLFVKIFNIRKFSLLIPSHLYTFLLHGFCLYETEAFPKCTIQCITERNLMMIDVVGYKYQLSFHMAPLLLYYNHNTLFL